MNYAAHWVETGRVGGSVDFTVRGRARCGNTLAVVTRDGTWHAYVIPSDDKAAFSEWVRDCGEWCNADGEFDAEIDFRPLLTWG